MGIVSTGINDKCRHRAWAWSGGVVGVDGGVDGGVRGGRREMHGLGWVDRRRWGDCGRG